MGRSRLTAAFCPLLALLLLVACSRPDCIETFVKASDAPAGVYSFEADFTDTLATWDLSLYTRIDGPARRLRDVHALPLKVEWTAPSGERFSEMVEIPLTRPAGSRFCLESQVPYRTGVVPVEAGVWTIDLIPQAPPDGFRGMGLITERRDGTR